MADTPTPQMVSDGASQAGWMMYSLWTGLGMVGGGISIGIKKSKGEAVNKWAAITAVVAGMATAGACTQALVSFAHLEAYWSGAVALLLGLMAMGFMVNAVDGKVPYINKFMGGPKQ